jgi:hypothetical protein
MVEIVCYAEVCASTSHQVNWRTFKSRLANFSAQRFLLCKHLNMWHHKTHALWCECNFDNDFLKSKELKRDY